LCQKKWRALINNFVFGGSVAIKVNDDVGRYFQTKKGLRQGDPLSLMLFNIVADMLAILIDHAKVDGQIEEWFPTLWMGDCLFFNTLTIQLCLWITI
jgi:hypothetical protein